MFALLGSNPQISVGADSTIAPLFAVAVAHLAPAGSPRYVDPVGILAVAVGVSVALVWLLRLGWIAEFLSAPIIIGFLAGCRRDHRGLPTYLTAGYDANAAVCGPAARAAACTM